MAGRKMSEDDIQDFLDAQKIGTLSMAGDGIPYAVPVAYSFDGTFIYIAMIRLMSRTLSKI